MLECLSDYSVMDETINEARKDLLEKHYVQELEILHNVDIQTEAVDLACSIVGRYYEPIMVKQGKMHCSIPDAEMLVVEALYILEKACLELKDDKDTELIPIHREGYLMLRNLVELSEFRKEKPNSEGLSYLAYLEKENEILRHLWNEVVVDCESVLAWHKNPQRVAQLVKLRDCVCQILKSEIRGDEIVHELRGIHTLLDGYKRSIPATILQHQTISPHMVAKVASPLTGIPTSWLANSFRPPVDGLEDRLTRRMVGEDRAIKRVANIMSRPPSSGDAPSPLASFLFLPFSWVRLEEFFESLAEELYDSKDRLAWFNLKMRTNSTSSSGVEIRDEWDAIQEKIIEVVKSTPFCALLFENAGASEYTTAFLENILKHGKLVDKQGKAYDLSNTLIIMTSTFGCGIDVRKALKCNCKYLEMDCPMVEDAGTMSSKDLECERLLLHKKVLGPLWDIHELVDDVLVLNGLPLLAREVITRVQLRNELEASGKEKQLILYPSEAVVRLIIYSYVDLIEKDGLESCIKKEIIPSIYLGIEGMQPLNMATIHMDALVGSMEKWSYRPLEVGSALAAFKESLSQWKTMYQNEKRSATEIVELSSLCSQLLFLMQNVNEPDRVIKWLKDMENNLDSIISNQVNSSFIQCELNLVPPKIELPEIETKVPYPVAYSNVMEGVRSKFSSAPGGKYRLLSLMLMLFLQLDWVKGFVAILSRIFF